MATDFNTPIIDPRTVSMRATAVRYGTIWGVGGIVLILGAYLLGINNASGKWEVSNILSSVLSTALTIWAVVMAVKHHRDHELGGYITVGRAASMGGFTGLIAGVISGIFMFIFLSFIAPDYFNESIEMQRAQLEERGMSAEEIETGLSMARMFMTPAFMGVMSVASSLLGGAIVGLIAGLFMKRESPRAF